MTVADRADVWVLLGPHKGDNDQVLALARALGLRFRTIQLSYRWFAHLPAVARLKTLFQLLPDARNEIAPPWPRLVLGIGQRSVPVARFIKKASRGRAKIVRLGDPMVSHDLFDLVITTAQYAVRDGDNVVRLPLTVTNPDVVQPNRFEQDWLNDFPQPRRLLVIGGKTSLWRFDRDVLRSAARSLARRARDEGGSVIAVTSPRTSPALLSTAQAELGETAVVASPFPRYGALLDAADEIHVTGDSVSMLSDAVASGKPVGLIKLEPDVIGRFVTLAGRLRGRPFRIRTLDRFWNDLEARGLIGTIEHPLKGSPDISPIDLAVSSIRELLGETPSVIQTAAPARSSPKAVAL